MKRQSLVFLLGLTLASGMLSAQTTTNPSSLPADQRVDQSGQPETGSGPDVDVDAGRNAEDGLVDVDVNSQTDSDTAATGNDPNPVVRSTTATGTTTGTVTGSSALQNEPEEGMDVDVDTGANAAGAVDVDVNSTSDADTDASGVDETGSLDQESTGVAGDDDSLPATGSDLPALALLGLLAMAAGFAVRFLRA